MCHFPPTPAADVGFFENLQVEIKISIAFPLNKRQAVLLNRLGEPNEENLTIF